MSKPNPIAGPGPGASRPPVRVRVRRRLYHGWVVVWASFAATFVVFGAAYSFGAFFPVLEATFAARRADLSLAFSIAGFLYFALGAVSGPIADRTGPRGVVAAGIVLIAAGMALTSLAGALWHVLVLYGVTVGVGIGLVYVPSIGAVQPWFARRRGLASGLAVAGIGAGTLVVPPLAAVLIDWIGWRAAYQVLAALTAVVGLSAALLLDSRPDRRGFAADGVPLDPALAATGRSAPLPGYTLAGAARTRPFRLLCLAGLGTSFGIFVPFVHLVPYARDRGIEDTVAALLIGAIGLGSIVGRFALGSAADRFGRRRALAASILAMAGLLVVWSASDGAAALFGFALAFGLFYGGFVALIPALITDHFGPRAINGIIGVIYASVALGILVGPPLAGLAYDLTRDYTIPILGSALVTALSGAAVLLLPRPAPWPSSGHAASARPLREAPE